MGNVRNVFKVGLGQKTDMSQIDAEKRCTGHAAYLGGPQDCSVSAEYDGQIAAFGRSGRRRHDVIELHARGGQLGGVRVENTDPDSGGPKIGGKRLGHGGRFAASRMYDNQNRALVSHVHSAGPGGRRLRHEPHRAEAPGGSTSKKTRYFPMAPEAGWLQCPASPSPEHWPFRIR